MHDAIGHPGSGSFQIALAYFSRFFLKAQSQPWNTDNWNLFNLVIFYFPHRNGKSLGVAFDNVKTGPSYAYFPAVSLSPGDIVQANFGIVPFQYPLMF